MTIKNIKNLSIRKSTLIETSDNITADPVIPIFKKILDYLHVPYADGCCPASGVLPSVYNPNSSTLQYYDPTSNTYIDIAGGGGGGGTSQRFGIEDATGVQNRTMLMDQYFLDIIVGNPDYSGALAELLMQTNQLSFYLQQNGSTYVALFAQNNTMQFIAAAGTASKQLDVSPTAVTIKTDGAAGKNVVTSINGTLAGTDGNVILAAGGSTRFGIEDITTSVTRTVDMSSNTLNLKNASQFNLTDSLLRPAVTLGYDTEGLVGQVYAYKPGTTAYAYLTIANTQGVMGLFCENGSGCQLTTDPLATAYFNFQFPNPILVPTTTIYTLPVTINDIFSDGAGNIELGIQQILDQSSALTHSSGINAGIYEFNIVGAGFSVNLGGISSMYITPYQFTVGITGGVASSSMQIFNNNIGFSTGRSDTVTYADIFLNKAGSASMTATNTVTIGSTAVASKGITGYQDYTADITDLDYAQKKYVDNVVKVANDFANDAAAATGGIAVGHLYHTAGTVKVRLT